MTMSDDDEFERRRLIVDLIGEEKNANVADFESLTLVCSHSS